MKAMMKCDLICLKSALRSTALTAAIIAVVVCIGMGSTYVVMPCVTCCVTVTLLYNLLAFDEQNDWQRLRLTLPLSRDQVIEGRYTSCLTIVGIALAEGIVLTLVCVAAAFALQDSGVGGFAQNILLSAEPLGLVMAGVAGSAIAIVMMALTIPIAAKTGLTKAIRILPLVFVLVIVVFMGLGQGLGLEPDTGSSFILWLQTDMGALLSVLILLVVVCALYAGSCVLAKRFYARREL